MDLDLADMPLRNLHSGTSIIRRLTLPSSLRRVQGGRGFGDRSSACRMGPGTVLGGNPSRPCRYQSTWQPPLHPPPRFSGRHFRPCALRPLAMCTMFSFRRTHHRRHRWLRSGKDDNGPSPLDSGDGITVESHWQTGSSLGRPASIALRPGFQHPTFQRRRPRLAL